MSNDPKTGDVMKEWPMTFDPPSWLRHFLPWWLLHYLDRRYRLCWTGVAMWKMGYEWSWGPPNPTCFGDGEPTCYCGKMKP